MSTRAKASRVETLPRLLFGDNQFFGVNHMSEDKARAQQMRFQDVASIMAVIDAAYDEGVTTFMCTTHDRVAEICDIVRGNPGRYDRLRFYPGMPYAHKYANSITEAGYLGTLRRFMPQQNILMSGLQGTRSLATGDLDSIAGMLIDAEMSMFRGLPTPVVWLQNIVADLFLGLGFTEGFAMFANHVRDKYGAEPGFITMNLPLMLDGLEAAGLDDPIVCANINKVGFRMPGGAPVYVEALRQRRFRAVAMSVFASGAIPPREAIEWVCALPNIQSIVFGASSRTNIAATSALVKEFWPQ